MANQRMHTQPRIPLGGIKILRVVELPWGFIVDYLGRKEAFQSDKFIPTQMFDLGKSPVRQMCRDWFKKKTGKDFPDGVTRISVTSRAKQLFLAEVSFNTDEKPVAPYIPPGEVWPQDGDPRFKPHSKTEVGVRDFGDVYNYNGPHIATDVYGSTEPPKFSFFFSGKKEQLINTGIVRSDMFPKGHTPTGKRRTEKKGKTELGEYNVSEKENGLYAVYFYESITGDIELEAFKEVFMANEKNEKRRTKNKWDDDEDDGTDDINWDRS